MQGQRALLVMALSTIPAFAQIEIGGAQTYRRDR
jgi:hypothetical protein